MPDTARLRFFHIPSNYFVSKQCSTQLIGQHRRGTTISAEFSRKHGRLALFSWKVYYDVHKRTFLIYSLETTVTEQRENRKTPEKYQRRAPEDQKYYRGALEDQRENLKKAGKRFSCFSVSCAKHRDQVWDPFQLDQVCSSADKREREQLSYSIIDFIQK